MSPSPVGEANLQLGRARKNCSPQNGDLSCLRLPFSRHSPFPSLISNPEGKAKVEFFSDLGCTVQFLKLHGPRLQLSGVTIKPPWGVFPRHEDWREGCKDSKASPISVLAGCPSPGGGGWGGGENDRSKVCPPGFWPRGWPRGGELSHQLASWLCRNLVLCPGPQSSYLQNKWLDLVSKFLGVLMFSDFWFLDLWRVGVRPPAAELVE